MEFGVVLQWLLAMAVLTGLGAPIAAYLFAALPRRGAAFALPTSLVPLVVAVFWIGQWTFGVHTVLVAVAILAVGAALAYRDGARPDWRPVAGAFSVFALGFAIMVVFRASAPAITPAGGEQYLHFGLVNALERAPHLPPEDFWFAGEPLKYYYGTQLQATSWSMLSGTPVRYGFNLAIATFYGVLFVVAYGLVGAIVGRRGYSRRLGGALGAIFVAIAGPTTTPIRFVTPYLPDGIQEPVSQAAFGFADGRFGYRFPGEGLQSTVAALSNPMDWTWWYTRYVVPGTIQEVPLYSFVKGELHGHTHSTGYVLFAGALAYAYYRTPAEAKARRAAIVFGGLGAIAGVFGFMNTWSLPTAGGLAVLTVAAADPHPATLLPESIARRLQPWADADRGSDAGMDIERLLHEGWRLVLAGIAGVVVLLIGVVVASPFLVFGHVPTNDGLGILPATARSALGPFLVIYAGILAVAATYVLVGARPSLRRFERTNVGIGALGLLAAVLFVWLGLNFAVLAVTGPILLGAWLLVRTDRDDFALVLFVAGIGLWLSYEVVHAQLPAINELRWNTAMKVSVQGWTLAAAGAGAAVAVVLSRTHDRLAGRLAGDSDADDSTATAGSNVGGKSSRLPATGLSLASAVLVLTLLASLVFPTMVVATEVGDQVAAGSWEPTLDGFDNLERWFPDQAAAIHWLGDRTGTPTIVEATGPSYGRTSPASVFTGLPTVVGWDHEAEYRTPEAYEARVQDVEEIYTANWSVVADHLARYEVEYVYVSENERERYGDELRSFDKSALSVAFEEGSVTIYAVDLSQL